MCLFKKLKRKINDLETGVNKLTKIIEDEELLKLRKKDKDLDFIKNNLSNVKLKVKSVNFIEDYNTGEEYVKVVYEQLIENIYIDLEQPICSDRFKSINLLNMVSYEDQIKIQEEIQKHLKGKN